MNKTKTNSGVSIIPKVTVLMSVYNDERFLRESVDSILNQTFRDFEFLIINDASTDGTQDILCSYHDPRIRLVENEQNIGLTRSLNKGLALARSEYIARLDADDRSHRERLERQVKFFKEHPDVDLLGTHARIIDECGRVIKGTGEYKAFNHLGISYHILFGNPFIHSSVMFRKNIIFDKFRGYDESYYYNQDFELWSRIVAASRTANLPDVLLDLRNHKHSVTKPSPETVEAFEKNFVRNIEIQKWNISRILGDDSYKKWPELWTRINVPYVKGYPDTPEDAIDMISKIHARFIYIYSEAKNDNRIRIVTAQAYFGLATFLASCNRKAAFRAFRAGLAFDYYQGLLYFPEFIFRTGHMETVGRTLKRFFIDLGSLSMKDGKEKYK